MSFSTGAPTGESHENVALSTSGNCYSVSGAAHAGNGRVRATRCLFFNSTQISCVWLSAAVGRHRSLIAHCHIRVPRTGI